MSSSDFSSIVPTDHSSIKIQTMSTITGKEIAKQDGLEGLSMGG